MNHILKRLIRTSALGLAGTLISCSSGIENATPNILFIMLDDLGWSDLACYGADLHETPNIDRLANSGMKFTSAYAAAPVCTPTRAAFLTGISPAALNMTIWREWAVNPQFDQLLIPPDAQANLPLGMKTIAECFHEAGYTTAHLGKWHVGDAEHFPELFGYDINVAAIIWGCPASFFFPYRAEIYDSQRYIPDLEMDAEGRYNLERSGEFLTDRLTDETIRILKDIGHQPFFISLNYYAVHTPIQSKPELTSHYERKSDSSYHHANPEYAGMVRCLDDNVGRLLSTLKELDLDQNTILILTSDNGGFINEWNGRTVTDNFPLRSGKGALYEGGIRVPLIVKWPGASHPGSTSGYPVITMDLYPTLLHISGLMQDHEMDTRREGIDLAPLIKDPLAEMPRRNLFWHYPHYYHTTTPASAVRSGKWKLIEYYEDGRQELYDLDHDLSEKMELSSQYPEKVTELSALLSQWKSKTGARTPVRNDRFIEQ